MGAAVNQQAKTTQAGRTGTPPRSCLKPLRFAHCFSTLGPGGGSESVVRATKRFVLWSYRPLLSMMTVTASTSPGFPEDVSSLLLFPVAYELPFACHA